MLILDAKGDTISELGPEDKRDRIINWNYRMKQPKVAKGKPSPLVVSLHQLYENIPCILQRERSFCFPCFSL